MPASHPYLPAERIELGGGRHLRIRDLLGTGSCASVLRAVLVEPHGVARSVAVKLFSAVSSDDREQVQALVAAAAARAACVRHPNVAAVYDCGVWRGQPYVVAELVEGVTLQDWLGRHVSRGRRPALDLALFVATEAAEALSGARMARDHEGVQLNLLHLGMSPRDVLLSWRGEVKVTDFEVSHARAASSRVRSLRTVASRVTLMAPEVAQGSVGDARSDVFSLGVLMRELLIGPRFGRSMTNVEAIRLAREGFLESTCFAPHLPDALVRVMSRALRVDPAARFPNATAMVYELRKVAMAMGVGDGRYFLGKALERDFAGGAGEITLERRSKRGPAAERTTSRGVEMVDPAELIEED